MKKNHLFKTLIPAFAVVLTVAGCGKEGLGADVSGNTEPVQVSGNTVEDPVATGKTLTVLDYNMNDYYELGDYLSMDVVYSEVNPSEEEVEYVYSNYYNYFAQTVDPSEYITDRAVEDGDLISLDFCGKKDGVAFEGGTSTGYILGIGTGTFIPGFEEGLVGVMPGEEIDLDLTFPEDYGSEDLAGQAVVFTCTVQGIISEESVLALANQFLQDDITETIDSTEELKNIARADLIAQYADEAQSDLWNQITSQLVAILTEKTPVPQELKDAYETAMLRDLTEMASYYQMDVETIAAYYGFTLDEMIVTEAADQLKYEAAVWMIATENNLISDEAEFERYLEDSASYSGMTKEEMLADHSVDEYKVYYMMGKVKDYLIEYYMGQS